ncbi:MAG: heparinase II/III family protein [Opitutaceae bacterium]|nr:heparinase II/III family protein [Opitutaceae bacterium]
MLASNQWVRPLPPLNYDPSAYELTAAIPRDAAPWTPAELRASIRARAAEEMARREMRIHYYRIGHTLTFPLPVARRFVIDELPVGIANLTYPWLIWLSWELEERWRILHAAWRLDRDAAAGLLLQQELAALTAWDCFQETHNEVGLVTGHLAAVLALVLADESGWDATHLAAARRAADILLDRDVAPWLPRQWPEGQPLTPLRLHNIPVIALVRAAQLARVCGHALTAQLDRSAIAVVHAWSGYRTGAQPHTEGTAYDGYLMDSVTGWLAHLPARDALLAETREAWRSQLDQWLGLTLPGRPDLHAPLGDTEPEMPFWIMPLLRLAQWQGRADAGWLLRRIPVSRLPAAALIEALDLPDSAASPAADLRELANAVVLRSGWQSADHVAVLSAPRCGLHHLHDDGGHFLLGWQARFWITDPGYQQYRPGEERDYSIGPAAHNAPVINGRAQSAQAARVLSLQTEAAGRSQTALDLTRCYADLPSAAVVRRTLWAEPSTAAPLVVLRDDFDGLADNTEILTPWLGGTHLAWAFVDGWARLSDGTHALWLGTAGDGFSAKQLSRHPGSRGPLTLRHTATLPTGQARRWWIVWGDTNAGWTPPRVTATAGRLTVQLPTAPDPPHHFG